MPASKNIDILCLQLYNKLPELENPLKEDVKKFLEAVQNVLRSSNAKLINNNILEQVFDLRFKALKWLLQVGDFDLFNVFNQLYPEFEKYKSDPKLSVLAENILFALRCNRRVVGAFAKESNLNEESFRNDFEQVASLSFEKFKTSLSISVPNQKMVQSMVDWIHATLEIEFGMVGATLIFQNQVAVTKKKIDELSALIANAAQNYIACAMELGYLKQNDKSYRMDRLPAAAIKEQQRWAEWGLDEYAERLANE